MVIKPLESLPSLLYPQCLACSRYSILIALLTTMHILIFLTNFFYTISLLPLCTLLSYLSSGFLLIFKFYIILWPQNFPIILWSLIFSKQKQANTILARKPEGKIEYSKCLFGISRHIITRKTIPPRNKETKALPVIPGSQIWIQ